MTQTSTDLPPVEQLINQLQSFMDEYIYPNEERYQEQLNNLENRFSTVPLMEELKARAPFWKKEVTDEGERWVHNDLRSSEK